MRPSRGPKRNVAPSKPGLVISMFAGEPSPRHLPGRPPSRNQLSVGRADARRDPAIFGAIYEAHSRGFWDRRARLSTDRGTPSVFAASRTERCAVRDRSVCARRVGRRPSRVPCAFARARPADAFHEAAPLETRPGRSECAAGAVPRPWRGPDLP
jgi:hypothetical protein